MSLDLFKLEERLNAALENISDEEIERFFPSDKRPDGWNELSEENLPLVPAMDAVFQGGSIHLFKDADGKEFHHWVGADTYAWWILTGKKSGFTHWFKQTTTDKTSEDA